MLASQFTLSAFKSSVKHPNIKILFQKKSSLGELFSKMDRELFLLRCLRQSPNFDHDSECEEFFQIILAIFIALSAILLFFVACIVFIKILLNSVRHYIDYLSAKVASIRFIIELWKKLLKIVCLLTDSLSA